MTYSETFDQYLHDKIYLRIELFVTDNRCQISVIKRNGNPLVNEITNDHGDYQTALRYGLNLMNKMIFEYGLTCNVCGEQRLKMHRPAFKHYCESCLPRH